MMKSNSVALWLFYATVFTLPMFMRINNLLLGAFILVAIVGNLRRGLLSKMKRNLIFGLPVVAFFGLAVLGAFRDTSLENLGFLEKHWSLLLVPLAMLPDPQPFMERKRAIFLAFMWGCTATLLICYTQVIWEMISGGEPPSYFFRWRHLGSRFTKGADTHPTYLAVFVVVSVFFLIQDKKSSITLKSILIPILILGLFQLASRIALFLCILLLLFLIVERVRRNNWQLASLVFGLVLGSLLVNYYGSDYLKQRIFASDVITDERRFARWEVSYEIFKDQPVLGVGYAKIEHLRRIGYLEKGLDRAASDNDNAHNQFLEYLSTQGAVGGIVYVLCLMYLFLLAIFRRDILFAIVFFALLVAGSTESMLVRIKGIEYLAVFGTLLMCIVSSNKTGHEDLHHA
ncbi:O-antigen ligase [Robiginitalea sp. SC105]|uniref:O-antigen ligase family protein n=1 Tax=Robiginitalea sp. SC105 TaxID=2762332 RepID=UPI00163997B5|nr:O-antigen ligase family protein [Robiginitalea sp. SC105]MBC2838240.1 O-antigen ligase family protein [Robiginitalea sp. SC105]